MKLQLFFILIFISGNFFCQRVTKKYEQNNKRDYLNMSKSDTLFLFHNDTLIERYVTKKIEPILFKTKDNIKRQIGVREEYFICPHCQGFFMKKRDSLFYKRQGINPVFHENDTGDYFYKTVDLTTQNYAFYLIHLSISSDYVLPYKEYITSQTNRKKEPGSFYAKRNFKLTTNEYYGNEEEIKNRYAFYNLTVKREGVSTYFSPSNLLEYLMNRNIVIYLQENDESVKEGMALFKEVYFDFY